MILLVKTFCLAGIAHWSHTSPSVLGLMAQKSSAILQRDVVGKQPNFHTCQHVIYVLEWETLGETHLLAVFPVCLPTASLKFPDMHSYFFLPLKENPFDLCNLFCFEVGSSYMALTILEFTL